MTPEYKAGNNSCVLPGMTQKQASKQEGRAGWREEIVDIFVNSQQTIYSVRRQALNMIIVISLLLIY